MAVYLIKRDSLPGLFNFTSIEDANKLCRGLKDKFDLNDLILLKIENDILERIDISNDDKYKINDDELLKLLGLFIK